MKARHPWGWPAALVWALSILPLVAAAATPPAASEQWSAVELPQPLTRETIRELVARLSDGEVRALLLAQLDKAASPTDSAPAAPMATGLAGDIDRARTEIGAVLRSWRELPAALGAAVTRFSEGRARSHLLLVASLFVVMLTLGWIAERLVGHLLAGIRGRLDCSPRAGPGAVGLTAWDSVPGWRCTGRGRA